MESMKHSQSVALDHSDTELNLTYAYSFLLPRQNPPFCKFTTEDPLEVERLWDVYNNFGTRNCGEAAATKSRFLVSFRITMPSDLTNGLTVFALAVPSTPS